MRRLDINFNDFAGTTPSRFGLIVAHTDLDGEVSCSSPGHTKDFVMVPTAPQPVLVIMSLSNENALAIKRRSS